MRQETSKWAGGGRGCLALAMAVVAGAISLIGAGPARANNDFQNGFEDELGRIVATQAAAFGAHVLAGAAYPVAAAVAYYPPVPVYAPVVYAPSYGPRHAGYGYSKRPKRLKIRQVVYYQGQPCNDRYDRYDHAPRGGRHGRGGQHSHGHRYGHDRD